MTSENTIARIDMSDAGRYGYRSLQRSGKPYEPRYFLDDSMIPSEYGHELPSVLQDLLDISAAVMWVDRMNLRSRDRLPYAPLRGWSRVLPVTLGVRNVDLWQQPEVKDALESLLFWLTEDTWDLSIVPYSGARRQSDMQSPLFASPSREHLIVLDSGGLDSQAGIVRLLEEDPKRSIVLMSAVHNRQRLRRVIDAQVKILRQRYGEGRILFAPLPFYVVKKRFIVPGSYSDLRNDSRHQEHTQRTRGFLFLTFAAAVSAVFNAGPMVICENGIGAINLPMDWSQLGSQNARAVHPRTLVLMTNLLKLIGLGQLSYEMPYLLSTKAELCKILDNSALQSLVRLTVSCDGFPHHFTNITEDAQLHCGWCTSCVLRRQGIYAAGLGDVETASYYRRDICTPAPDLKPSYFEPLKKMADQAFIFGQATGLTQTGAALAERFPELLDTASIIEQRPSAFGLTPGQDAMVALADLFGRYSREWERFPYKLRSGPSYKD